MDAKLGYVGVVLATLSLAVPGWAAGARSKNFIVTASDAQFARTIAAAAERYRRDLALDWLGKELPPWREPCPIRVHDGPRLGAGGETSFMFDGGRPFGWQMMVQGSRERILDSVLPHEITHTIFATHFGRPLPRWADEGACSTVEHEAERSKLERHLLRFLANDRGIAFRRMFAMRDYPKDILPLYAQGYSLSRFLIQQGGRRRFIQFVGDGMQTGQWERMVERYYGYEGLGKLQDAWLAWIRQGRPVIAMPISVPAASAPAGNASPSSIGTPRTGAPTRTASTQETGAAGRLDLVPLAPQPAARLTGSTFAPGSTGRSVVPIRSAPRRLTRPQGLQEARQQVHEWSAR